MMKRFKKVMVFVRPFLRQIITAVVLTGVLTLIGMAPPLIMRRLLNDVAKDGEWGLFPLLMGLLCAVPLLRAGVNVVNAIVLNRISLGIIRRTRVQIYRHLMRLTMRFYAEMPVGGISQRLLGDVAAVSGVATGGMIMLVTDVVAVVFAVVVMLGLSLPLSLLTLALLPLYYLNYRFFSKRIQSNTAALRSHMDHISASLQERLSAHELIQSYGQEKTESTHFDSQAKQVMDASLRGSALNISFSQLAAFINHLGNTLIYCAAAYYFVKGRMGYGDVVAFCAYATQLLGPVVRFIAVANQMVQAGVSVDRINEVLHREPALREEPNAAPVKELKGDIDVDGVSFAYAEGEIVLKNVHLHIEAGTHMVITGSPDAGRSTLAMLLRRFFDPTEGRIRADGKDIRSYRLRDYRRVTALIQPESALFDGTIRENLLYGRPDAPEARMIEVAQALGLHDFVDGLSEGYDTRLGAGALVVATGVQQMIGIARALISEPSILIADEVTASLDADTAEHINEALLRLMKGRTVLLIAHRALVGRRGDTVAVMAEGAICETGSHGELAARPNGAYRALLRLQYGDHVLPPEGGAP